MFANLEILIPGKAATEHPVISVTYLTIESDKIVHLRMGLVNLSETIRDKIYLTNSIKIKLFLHTLNIRFIL